jgi:hypothetical protein
MASVGLPRIGYHLASGDFERCRRPDATGYGEAILRRPFNSTAVIPSPVKKPPQLA